MHKIRLKTNERNTKRNSLKCGWGMKGLLTGTLAVAMSVSLWLHGGSSAYALASHGWFMSIGENSINATCDQECRSENPHTATLNISVEDFTYPGNAVGKSEIFKDTNFTEFNDATGKNVSVDNIKVYKSKDGEKSGAAISQITEPGEYIAELEITDDICKGGHEYSEGTVAISDLKNGDIVHNGVVFTGNTNYCVYCEACGELTFTKGTANEVIARWKAGKCKEDTHKPKYEGTLTNLPNVIPTDGFKIVEVPNPVAQTTFTVLSPHTHEWVYNVSADGSTITAYCSNTNESSYCECQGKDNAVSLTLKCQDVKLSYQKGYDEEPFVLADGNGNRYRDGDAWSEAGAEEMLLRRKLNGEIDEYGIIPGEYTVEVYPKSEEDNPIHIASATFNQSAVDYKVLELGSKDWEYSYYLNNTYESDVAGDLKGEACALFINNVSGTSVDISDVTGYCPKKADKGLLTISKTDYPLPIMAELISDAAAEAEKLSTKGLKIKYDSSKHSLTLSFIEHDHKYKYTVDNDEKCIHVSCEEDSCLTNSENIYLKVGMNKKIVYPVNSYSINFYDEAWKALGIEYLAYYEGINDTVYEKSKDMPDKLGTYNLKVYPKAQENNPTDVLSIDFEILAFLPVGKCVTLYTGTKDWEYSFYTDGTYSSSLDSDPAGEYEKIAFVNCSDAEIEALGEKLTYGNYEMRTGIDYWFYGLFQGNGVGVKVIYNAADHKLEYEAINHKHEINPEKKHAAVAGNCVDKGTLEWYNCKDATCEVKLDKYGRELSSIEGEKDPSIHKSDKTTWTRTETTHEEKYDCCGAVKTKLANHTYGTKGTERYTCSVCGYENAKLKAAFALSDTKEAALLAIKDEVAADTSANVIKAADSAKEAINNATSIEDVASKKEAGIEAIRAAKQANKDAAEKEANAVKAAAAVAEKINGIGSVTYTEECKTKIADARAAYEALEDIAKAKVSEEQYKVLTDAEAEYAALEKKAADDELAQKQAKANEIAINAKLKLAVGSNVTVSWGKVTGASGYDVYMSYYTKGKLPVVKTVKSAKTTSATIKKLKNKKIDQSKIVKCKVVAYKLENGKKVTLTESIDVYAAGSKYKKATNAKSIKLAKTKYTLSKGKSVTIKATTVKKNSKMKVLSKTYAAEFRYASSDEAVAKVSKTGKITAKGKGSCYVYVYAANGNAGKIKVTVK